MELEIAKRSKQFLVGVSCLLGLGLFLTTIYSHEFNVVENYNTITTADVGMKLLSYEAGGFILPFEVISILLLAAMIGAIIIAKGKKLSDKKR